MLGPTESCIPCTGMTYSGHGTTCRECPAPLVVNDNHTQCSACPPGRGPDADRTSCLDCTGSAYSSQGTTCAECPAPLIVNAEHTECSACSPGRGANADLTSCEDCTGSTYSVFAICQVCTAPGVVSPDHTSCSFCSPGSMPNENRTACSNCSPGRYSPSGVECEQCERPLITDGISCDLCPEGSGLPWDATSAGSCQNCTGQQYSSNGRCAVCQAPNVVNAAHTACDTCLCQNGGTCTNGLVDQCDCAPGWTGDLCETNIDECLSASNRTSVCANDATCIDGVNAFQCV
jgi:hypothetical protein